MISPIPEAAPHHSDAVLAFQQSFVWTANQLSLLFTVCGNPRRSAEAWLRRWERAGYFASSSLDAVSIDFPREPIHCQRLGEPDPDFDALEYRLRIRWNKPAKRTRVFWPTPTFARAYGMAWLGSDELDSPHKVSHDLLCSSVWLSFIASRPDLATDAWTSERELQYRTRRGQRSGPIPDAIVDDTDLLAIEIGGSYPANYLRRHAERFADAGLAWELW